MERVNLVETWDAKLSRRSIKDKQKFPTDATRGCENHSNGIAYALHLFSPAFLHLPSQCFLMLEMSNLIERTPHPLLTCLGLTL